MSAADRFFFGCILGCIIVVTIAVLAILGEVQAINDKTVTPVVEEAR